MNTEAEATVWGATYAACIVKSMEAPFRSGQYEAAVDWANSAVEEWRLQAYRNYGRGDLLKTTAPKPSKTQR